MKRSISAPLFLFIAMSGSAVSAASPPVNAEISPAVPYTYGMTLNIAKVISIEKGHSNYCEVVQSRMTFVDEVGMRRAITYLEHSDACLTGD
jgi:hypothetical protein